MARPCFSSIDWRRPKPASERPWSWSTITPGHSEDSESSCRPGATTLEAIYYYLRYLLHDPDDVEILINTGAALHNTDDYQEALRYYGRAEKRGGKTPLILENRGRALHALGKIDQAIESLRGAIELEPNDSVTRTYLGSLLQSAGQEQAALKEFESAIALDPENAEAPFNAAIVLDELDRPAEAAAHAEHALRVIRETGDVAQLMAAYGSLGWLYYRSGRLEESITMSRQALEIDATVFWIRFNLALTLLVSGQREAAESEYRTGLTYVSLANDLKLHAIIDLEDALRQNPEVPGGRDVLQMLKDKYAEMNNRVANLSQISPELKARYEALANPVAVTSNLPPGTFALTATADSELERASDELAGGLLTRFLVEGLEGGADLDSDGSITADELGEYVLSRVRAAQAQSSRAPSEPLFWSNPPPEGTLVVRGGRHSDIAGVIVAVGDHADPAAFPHLRQARMDGQRIFETFRRLG